MKNENNKTLNLLKDSTWFPEIQKKNESTEKMNREFKTTHDSFPVENFRFSGKDVIRSSLICITYNKN